MFYTAVSVWLCDDRRSTSISGIDSSSGILSAYSIDDVCDKRLLNDVCFRRTSANVVLLCSP